MAVVSSPLIFEPVETQGMVHQLTLKVPVKIVPDDILKHFLLFLLLYFL